MFNFNLQNGSLIIRVFVALTVALCIWSAFAMTGYAVEESLSHVHQGDEVTGGSCYEPVYHKHTGSKSKGTGCYGKAVYHSHTGNAALGTGCYGDSIFHSHTGSSSQGGGCYQTPISHKHVGNETEGGGCYQTPILHTHVGNETEGGACYATPVFHQHQGIRKAEYPNGCYTQPVIESVGYECGTFIDQGDDTWKCRTCGWVIPSWNLPLSQRHWPYKDVTVYIEGCNKTEETVESYVQSCEVPEGTVEGYALSCQKGGYVERYDLSCGKTESTVESHGLSCGKQQGQVEYYERNCGMTEETIVGYVLSCEWKEGNAAEGAGDGNSGTEAGQTQPVKVPMNSDAPLNPMPVADEGDSGDGYIDDILQGTQSIENGQSPETGQNIEAGQHIEAGQNAEDAYAIKNGENGSGKYMLSAVAAEKINGGFLLLCLATAVFVLGVRLYFNKTLALFYYDETNHYHSLGRVPFHRTQKGYHVEIGNGIRKKATKDRYRIRTNKSMRKTAENQDLYVRISTQIMKLRVEEYVDFAL